MNNYLMITGMPEKAKAGSTDSETVQSDPEVTDIHTYIHTYKHL